MSIENGPGTGSAAPTPDATSAPEEASTTHLPPIPSEAPPVTQTVPRGFSAPAPQYETAPPTVPAVFAANGPVNPYGPPPGVPGGAYGAYPPGPVAPVPRKRGKGGLVAAVLVAALLAGGVGGGVGYWSADRDSGNSTTVSSSGGGEALNRAPESVAGIAEKALPSVVTIEAEGSEEGGTGTGFVYDEEGHILTNNHVVAPAANGGKLSATFSDGKKYEAEIVGRAEGYDVAVIKLKNVDAAKLAPLPLGNSDRTAIGDATIAIGAPFGLSGTVTTGIVSAMHRPVASGDGQGSSSSYMSAIQTDASINPGNSGGPLLNASGAVVGINSAIQAAGSATGQAGSVGLGFAIPINQAKNVADQLIETGEPVYPVIGVTVDMQFAGSGARITEENSGGAVTGGGPADQAGLKPGDVITKLDDTMIDSGPTLIGAIWQYLPGTQVEVTYERNGKTATAMITLGERKGDS